MINLSIVYQSATGTNAVGDIFHGEVDLAVKVVALRSNPTSRGCCCKESYFKIVQSKFRVMGHCGLHGDSMAAVGRLA
jgi:hypothetical protein